MKALDLVREVRRCMGPEQAGWAASLDAALAELERDQAFIEAAERLCEHDSIASLEALLAAYRARREERGKA